VSNHGHNNTFLPPTVPNPDDTWSRMEKLMKPSQSLATAFLLALCISPMAFGQDEKEAAAPAASVNKSMIFATSNPDGTPGEVQFFSTSGMEGPMAFSVGGMGPMSDAFSLANNPDVQKEIELLDDQLKQLNSINADFSKRIQEEMGNLVNGDISPDRGREIGELIKKLNQEKQTKMEGVLLPHQFARLRQIAFQQQMKFQGDANAIMSDKVAQELGLTEEQKKKLAARAEELKKELEEKIAKLKQETRESLLGELTGEQREKLKEMMGGAFDLKTPEFGERIRRTRSGSGNNAAEKPEK
jgi:hypothetical protein